MFQFYDLDQAILVDVKKAMGQQNANLDVCSMIKYK